MDFADNTDSSSGWARIATSVICPQLGAFPSSVAVRLDRLASSYPRDVDQLRPILRWLERYFWILRFHGGFHLLGDISAGPFFLLCPWPKFGAFSSAIGIESIIDRSGGGGIGIDPDPHQLLGVLFRDPCAGRLVGVLVDFLTLQCLPGGALALPMGALALLARSPGSPLLVVGLVFARLVLSQHHRGFRGWLYKIHLLYCNLFQLFFLNIWNFKLSNKLWCVIWGQLLLFFLSFLHYGFRCVYRHSEARFLFGYH